MQQLSSNLMEQICLKATQSLESAAIVYQQPNVATSTKQVPHEDTPVLHKITASCK